MACPYVKVRDMLTSRKGKAAANELKGTAHEMLTGAFETARENAESSVAKLRDWAGPKIEEVGKAVTPVAQDLKEKVTPVAHDLKRRFPRWHRILLTRLLKAKINW
ncbi:hypothetical protein RQN30_07530 [Arcanobacterium hippocoleae]